MNAIDHQHKVDQGSVYGAAGMVLCAHPHCSEVFKERRSKKYHSADCKNDHHAIIRDLGLRESKRGKIRAALLENSPRLQRVARFLNDGNWHSTREIIRGCDVCAVNAIVDELREPKNGFDIVCERRGEYWYYKMIGGFEQLLRLV